MQPVSLDQIVGLDRYEAIRDGFRRRIIDLKRNRRVPVGDCITFVFENHDTVLFQIQEMLRAERITDIDKIRAEIECYNQLIPRAGELSSTMLIEITEQERIRQRLLQLQGIESAVRLEVGELKVAGEFEAGRSKDDKLSAVQYVRFALPARARENFVSGRGVVTLSIDHRNYRARAVVEGPIRASLAVDLADSQPLAS
jgi:hypothetical protein